jgi:hypothetical protein
MSEELFYKTKSEPVKTKGPDPTCSVNFWYGRLYDAFSLKEVDGTWKK